MTNFAFLPLMKITGNVELEINDSPVVDKLIVNESQIKFKLKEHDQRGDLVLIDFNVKTGVHVVHDEIENLPLELTFTTTIDFLDSLSSRFDLSTVLLDEPLESLDFVKTFLFFGDKVFLPFQVRKPSTKTIFSSVYNLRPIKANLMSPIEVLSDQYEDYLENALYSFLLNVSKPLREKEYEDMIKSQELLKVLDRIEDLSQIMTKQVDNIRERYRAFSRIMVPLIKLANLKKRVSDSVKLEYSNSQISYTLQYPKEIASEELAEFIVNKMKKEQ